jgi:hypothetical protein
MLTYFFNIELVSINPSSENGNVDIETDTVEIKAVDELIAVELLKDKFNISSEFFSQTIHSLECIGTLEEETF